MFRVNISNIVKILQFETMMTKLLWKLTQITRNWIFSFEGKQDDLVSHFSLNIISIDSDHLGIPEIEYPAVVKIRSNEFARVLEFWQKFVMFWMFMWVRIIFFFFANGRLGDGEITLKLRENWERLIEIDFIENLVCSYDVKYFNLFCRAGDLGIEVQLSISKILRILRIISTFEFELGFIKYYLAPKVNGE